MNDIRASLKEILRRLGSGDVTLETLQLRVKLLERVVFGAVGIILIAVIGALIALVVPGFK